MLAMAHGAAEKRVSASPFVGLPVDGGLTAPSMLTPLTARPSADVEGWRPGPTH